MNTKSWWHHPIALAALAVGLGACSGKAPEELCDGLVARYQSCAATDELPKSALASMNRYCDVAMQYRPEPGDAQGNIAALTKTALEACAAKPSCDALIACLEASRCTFYVDGPADKTLEFSCLL